MAQHLEVFGAVSIEGPKWCGKTWTALNHANSVTYLMDPAGSYSNRTKARLDPALVLEGEQPHVLDEWQEVPSIWDAVRFDVDQRPGAGKYILTGSVTPPRSEYRHSGAGRISTVRMRSMSLFESGDSQGLISFASLFQGEPLAPFAAPIELKALIDLVIRGGWPQTLRLPIKGAGAVADEYLNAVVRNELFNKDSSRRSPAKLRKLLRSLARNNATTVTDKALSMYIDGAARQHQQAKEITLSRQTVAEYTDELKTIFVIEDIPAWDPSIRSRIRIRQSAKRVYTDPSLAVAALGVGRDHLLADMNTLGFMFENLCLRDLAVYADAMGGAIFHYRDNSGLEADAIVEFPDGAWGAFEIKLGEHQVDAAAKSLVRVKDKLIATGALPPSCLAVITGGGLGRTTANGVHVLPINALRP
jgi:predicted AAA+ superfamily ATPase